MKLFRIAKEDGADVARKIGDVLSGKTDLSLFLKQGGKEAELFKKNFGNILEQQQAKAFFKGDVVPDIKGMQGGRQIDIQEQAIRGASPVVKSRLQRDKLLRKQFPVETTKETPPVTVTNTITVNASSVKEVSEAVTKQWIKEAGTIGSEIRNKLENIVYGNQQSNR